MKQKEILIFTLEKIIYFLSHYIVDYQ